MGNVVAIKHEERLKQADRSDCCGVQAIMRLKNEAGLLLDFCLHHYKKNEIELELAGFKVIEDTSALLTFDRKTGSVN